MILNYEGKKSEEEILNNIKEGNLKSVKGNHNSKSKLILGDNLEVMKYLIDKMGLKGKIDFVYIDPPFATKNIFRISEGKANSISRSSSGNIAYDDSMVGAEYLEFIRERLILLKKLMSKRGSIYFHIDYKIGHYIKVLMDEIFGEDNFINDITRIKCNPKNFKRKAYGNIKDLILFYSKTKDYIWNEQKIPFSEEDIKRLFKKVDKDGRRYTTIPVHAPGETKNGATGQPWREMLPPKGNPRKKIYVDEREGKRVQDIWEFKDPQYPTYPTEKNQGLLDLIVKTSSNQDSIVLDCFCGSGTTLKSAHSLNRKWIGIDKSDLAIEATKNKLETISGDLFVEKPKYEYIELNEAQPITKAIRNVGFVDNQQVYASK